MNTSIGHNLWQNYGFRHNESQIDLFVENLYHPSQYYVMNEKTFNEANVI